MDIPNERRLNLAHPCVSSTKVCSLGPNLDQKSKEVLPLSAIYVKIVFNHTHKIAKLLASNISENSSTDILSPCFQKIKAVKEKKRLNFSSDNQVGYNLPFSLTELKQSLQKSNDSATGLDEVHYHLTRHYLTRH